MTTETGGVVLLSARAPEARAWVRGGVVPCHVVEHAAWSIVSVAEGKSAAGGPYDDAVRLLAARHVGRRLAPAIGFFLVDDAAVITARAPGRVGSRWALRGPDRVPLAGQDLAPLAPEHLHRVLGRARGSSARPVPLRLVHQLWDRTDLPHLDWLLEAMAVLGLPGARVLAGTDDDLGAVVRPNPRAVAAFESVVKDVHQ